MEESSYNYSGKNNNKNYCHGNSSSRSRSISVSVSNIDGGLIRKGPWKADEDQVLLNHVNKYGPRDWSSIRSKGLLHRTGKSCRLRWVNKLRPNLKTGCKFTAEEERVVIELQSELGNKWATIATHLAGRTDNDVKNFWSSRQKRLARLLQQSQSTQPYKRRKSSSSSSPTTTTSAATAGCAATNNCSYFIEVPKSSQSSSSSSHIGSTSTNTMQIITVPETKNPECPVSEANRDFSLCPIPLNECPCSDELQLDGTIFPSIPPLQTYLPFPPETQEFIDRVDSSFLQTFGCADDPILADDGLQLLSCCGGEMRGQASEKGIMDNPVTPDSFFDDFPSDMFEIEPLPSPSRW